MHELLEPWLHCAEDNVSGQWLDRICYSFTGQKTRPVAWTRNVTVDLPVLPTLPSVEVDFLIRAKSTHSVTQCAKQTEPKEKGGQGAQESKSRRRLNENKCYSELASFENGGKKREVAQGRLIWKTKAECYLWLGLCVTPWPAALRTRWADEPHQPEPTSAAGSHPLASGRAAPGRRCGQSPPCCWQPRRCHLQETQQISLCLDVNLEAEVEIREASQFRQKLSKQRLKWSKLCFLGINWC